MSGIAEVLLNLGFEVTGSDLRSTPVTRRLAELGGRVWTGHNPDQVAGADVVVVSSAIDPANNEVRQAREQQIPVIPRAEMLGELMRMKFAVAVSGSHGKTTTTSMIAVMLNEAGMDPTVVIGGRLNIFGSNARLGQGDFLVAEADESDGSFLKLFPTIAVITNIDAEHMNYYTSMDHLKRTFVDFINRAPFYGTAILGLDDPNVRAILPAVARRCLTYGFSADADFRVESVTPAGEGSDFTASHHGIGLGNFRLHVPGDHNIQNAMAAIATGVDLAIPLPVIQRSLEVFQGVDRRFQTRGNKGGIRVVDDYGHHPTEIRATLQAARGLNPGRLVAVFQPHRFSRLRDLWDEFAAAFQDVDLLAIAPVYPAGEAQLEGITSERLLAVIQARGLVDGFFEQDFDELARRLVGRLRPGDLVITFGAGNIYQVCDKILQRLEGS